MTREGYPKGYIGQHTLFERRVMNADPVARAWRQHPGMLIIMPESDEKTLHREMGGLPQPSRRLARRALAHLDLMPDTFGRLDMFNSVTHLMHDIADRSAQSPYGVEAAIFAEHFDNQRIFFDRALRKEEEDKVLTSRITLSQLGRRAIVDLDGYLKAEGVEWGHTLTDEG